MSDDPVGGPPEFDSEKPILLPPPEQPVAGPNAAPPANQPDEQSASSSKSAEERKLDIEYDPELTPPESMIGVRIQVLWAQNKWYSGVIDEYDPITKLHHVLYDDNDKKWYTLSSKTFRIISSGRLYQGKNNTADSFSSSYSTNAWSSAPVAFVPYVPKDPNVRTPVTFHCWIDSRAMDTAAGDVVTVRGSLAELGNWGPGQVLEQHPENSNIWFGTIALPFSIGESCQTGIFEYKFAIERVGAPQEAVLEAEKNRRVNMCIAHYYVPFRAENAHARFKSLKKINWDRTEMWRFWEQEILDWIGGKFPSNEVFARFDDLRLCFGNNNSNRDQAEDFVESVLDSLLEQPLSDERRLVMLLLLSGLIGTFGLSSQDKPVNQYPSYNPYNNMYSGYNYNYSAPPKKLKPRPWCHTLLDRISVESTWVQNLGALLGAHSLRALIGLQEASERMLNESELQWIRWTPLLARDNLLPTNEFAKVKKVDQKFADVRDDLIVRSQTCFELAGPEAVQRDIDYQIAVAAAQAAGQPAPPAPSGPTPMHLLGLAYLRALIKYAPDVEWMVSLFGTAMQHYVSDLVNDVCGWVRRFPFTKPDEISGMIALINQKDLLACPATAIALLANEASDAEVLYPTVLEFIKTCTRVPNRDGVDINALPEDQQAARRRAEEQELFALEGGVKEWIFRNHGNDAVDDKEKQNEKENSGWFNFGWNQKEDKKKTPPTEQELVQKRLAALSKAVQAVNDILNISYFDAHPQGVLFELTRCHFFKGDSFRVAQSLCLLGGQTSSFETLSPNLSRYMSLRLNKLVEDLVPSLAHQSDELVRVLTLVLESLRQSQLADQLLATLIFGLCGEKPNLSAILRHTSTWSTLFGARGVDPSKWSPNSPLTPHFAHTSQVLSDAATTIASGSINLKNLHQAAKPDEQQSLLRMLQLLRCPALTPELFSLQLTELSSFDQRLAEYSCFINFFCHCGVPIDQQAVHEKLQFLTSQYDLLTLNEVKRIFDDELNLYGQNLSWLFSLRDSTLFLEYWRRIGRLISAQQSESNEDEKAPELHEEDEDHQWSFLDLPLARGIGLEPSDPEKAEMQKRILTQQTVVDKLLPQVKLEWRALYHAVRDRSINVATLHSTFGALNNDSDSLKELLMLVRTGEGNLITSAISIKDDPQYRWIEEAAQQLHDFLLMERMTKWLPALLRVRELLQPLFNTEFAQDQHYLRLQALLHSQQAQWSQQTLGSLSLLVAPVKGEVQGFSMQQLNFLVLFSKSEKLIQWLLDHSNTADFNRLLQVCRPSTDEPRILSSMASLTYIRTMLLQFLFTKPPYSNLQELLKFFRDEVDIEGDTGYNHLSNIQSSFEGLLDVFEKQTRSPGIKAFFDVREIAQRGEFVVRAGVTLDQSLRLEFHDASPTSSSGKAAADELPSASQRSESLEYLLDLRSKLLMTEIPEEMEIEMQISHLVEAFVAQLALFIDIRDHVVSLNSLGHFNYQTFEIRFRFSLDGLVELQAQRSRLLEEIDAWTNLVSQMRSRYYFLNYFTMREILKIADILRRSAGLVANISVSPSSVSQSSRPILQQSQNKLSLPASSSSSTDSKPVAKKPEPKVVLPKIWACDICTFENPLQRVKCEMCDSERPAHLAVLIAQNQPQSSNSASSSSASAAASSSSVQSGPIQISSSAQDATQIIHEANGSLSASSDPLEEFCSYLYLASSRVDVSKASNALTDWQVLMTHPESKAAHDSSPANFFLASLGQMLDSIFKDSSAEPSDEKDALADASQASTKYVFHFRPVPPPGEKSQNRADMLITVDNKDENAIPVFCTQTEQPADVLQSVFSVFVRRGRLPEPGEILFCSSQTSLEEIELLILRFISARKFGRSRAVFCLADVHMLSYTTQCAVVDRLRSHLSETGIVNAAALLIVSGKPRQVLLNSLSAQKIDLPSLDLDSLRVAVRHSSLQNGDMRCVVSNINGGGKSLYVMTQVAHRQRAGDPLVYKRIPFRESSSHNSLVAVLSRANSKHNHYAFHFDIGHIIPESANVCLFELLLVGVIKSSKQNRVYRRRPEDVFYLEIPNSLGNNTRKSLHVCSLFETDELRVTSELVAFRRPIFTDIPFNTRISLIEFSELILVCKWLRAWEAGKLRPGQTFDAEYSPYMDQDITAPECFALLNKYCAPDGFPNWLVFNSFISFMNTAFVGMMSYPVFQAAGLSEGLETLRDVFVGLLVETSKDFSLRSVPRAASSVVGGAVVNMPPAAPRLQRSASSEIREREAELARPALVGALSEGIADRFAKMRSWEDTEHPIVLWYNGQRSEEVEGLDILSLNPRFLDRWINPALKDVLRANAIDFDFDWKKMQSERGMDIIRKVEGFSMFGDRRNLPPPPLEPGYVITVDNMTKMVSIQMRLKNNLPVVIMGETGCGKSSLITQLCAVIRRPLRTLNIHGGMEDSDILEWMQARIDEALIYPRERICCFLDEVNTCNCMGLFKEIICDRSINGVMLPSNLDIIAACNPYRLKRGLGAQQENMAGLVFEHHAPSADNIGTGIRDPLKDLVYRVHPLPESMIDFVFDFGALAPETERLYIKAMLRRQLAAYVADEKENAAAAAAAASNVKSTSSSRAAAASSSSSAQDDVMRQMGALLGDQNMRRVFEQQSAEIRRQQSNPVGSAEDQEAANMARQQASLDLLERLRQQAEASDREDQIELLQNMQEKLLQVDNNKFGANKMSPFGEFVDVFSELICAAQEFIRMLHGGERSVVSLRDVHRCIKVYRWFGEHFAHATTDQHVAWTLEDFFSVRKNAHEAIRQAVIMSLAYCYMSRLPGEERRQFRTHISDIWNGLQVPIAKGNSSSSSSRRGGGYNYWDFFYNTGPEYGPRCVWMEMEDPRAFQAVVFQVQRRFVSHMKLQDGIALNEALLENLFMILVSILNRIPIFIIGKPGSSKSLAVELVQSNLNGEASESPFLRTLPSCEVFSYQCSPLSTSEGIQAVFETAARYKREAPNTCVVVLLDEVGLAESSPHLPLKVLHKCLDEEGGGSVVGISNWTLDPAKMNRAVHLYRPAPTVEDLSDTAEGMVRSANLKGYLQSLARAYSAVYNRQSRADFWGLREFYSTIRAINQYLTTEKKALDGAAIMNAVQRNFGGRPHELDMVLREFSHSLGLPMDQVPRRSVLDLIAQNLSSIDARHLMVLTKNNAALGALFDMNLLAHEKSEVIFGSEFPSDRSDLYCMLNLQKIKTCMASGITVVLVHSEALYESLYDLLNQHYVQYGSQRFVRLAFGTHSRLCPIDEKFRIVCIVEKNDAYTRLAPPLLNRFEKQVLERQHLLTPDHVTLVKQLRSFVQCLAADLSAASNGASSSKPGTSIESLALKSGDAEADAVGLGELQAMFCGYHADTLSSLAQSVIPPSDVQTGSLNPETMTLRFQTAVQRLLWVATPESICRALKPNRIKLLQEQFNMNPGQIYFGQQFHADLSSFASNVLLQPSQDWRDSFGAQVALFTYAPFSLRVSEVLTQSQFTSASVCALHEMSSERDLIQKVNEFLDTARDGSVFVVQCDPVSSSVRRIQHARYILENARARHASRVASASSGAGLPGALKMRRNNSSGSSFVGDEKTMEADQSASAAPSSTSNLSSAGVHVVMLVHLPRSEGSFSFDFDLRWRYAFIDSIEPAQNVGLPDLKELLSGANLTQIMAQVDLPRVLQRVFRASMSRMVYMYQRSTDDVRQQIMFLLHQLESSSQAFMAICQPLIGELLEQSNASLDLMSVAQHERELAIAGTFQAALHRQITDVVAASFAVLLAHADRNCNLPLLNLADESLKDSARTLELQDVASNPAAVALMTRIWLALFSRSIRDSRALMVASASVSSNISRNIDVNEDGFGGRRFESRFPFSFYINRLLESMRSNLESFQLNNRSKMLQQQLELLSLPENVDQALPTSLLKAYVHDMICLNSQQLNNVSRSYQATLVWRLLCLVGFSSTSGSDSFHLAEPTHLSSIHARYWLIEFRLHRYFLLLDAVPSAQAKVLRIIESSPCVSSALDYQIIQAVLDDHMNSLGNWRNVDEYGSWLQTWKRLHPSIQALLQAQPETRQTVTCMFDSLHATSKRIDDEKGGDDEKLPDESSAASASASSSSSSSSSSTSSSSASASSTQLSPDQFNLANNEPTVAALLDGVESSLSLLQAHVMCINFVATFVRDFASTLKLPVMLTVSTVQRLMVGVQLRSRSTLQLLLRVFSDLNKEYARAAGEVECVFCYSVPRDPVRFCGQCRRLVCRSCVESFLQSPVYKNSKECFWCRNPNADNYVVDERDRKSVAASSEKERLLQAAASRVMEDYIFNVCFKSESVMEPGLLNDLVQLLSNRPDDGEPGLSTDSSSNGSRTIDVVPSSAARVSLLRTLLSLQDSVSRDIVDRALTDVIESSVSQNGFLDTPVSVSYAVLQEEFMANRASNLDLGIQNLLPEINFLLLQPVQANQASGSVRPRLETIAKARHLLTLFAEEVCNLQNGNAENAASAASSPQAILSHHNDLLSPLLCSHRSAAVFFLKQLERRRGLAFVRSMLQSPQFSNSVWFKAWKASGEVGLVRFLGDSKLPRLNPFIVLPLWDEVHSALASAIAPSGDLTRLNMCAVECSHADPAAFKAALLGALFHEVYLLQILEDVPAVTISRVNEVRNWLASSDAMSFCKPFERNLLRFFAGSNAFVGAVAEAAPSVFSSLFAASASSSALSSSASSSDSAALPPLIRPVFSLLSLSPQSSAEQIALVRVLAHVAVSVLLGENRHNSHLAWFRTLVATPERLLNTHFPCSPEDMLFMAVNALQGRFYFCSNGHAYYVDMCGRPTQILKCNVCGVDIGGLDHNLLSGQHDVDSNLENNTNYSQRTKAQDKSEANYCFRTAAQESNPFDTVRGLIPISDRAIRFMLHASIVIGCVAGASAPEAWSAKFIDAKAGLINRTYANPENAAQFFVDHVQNDWSQLAKLLRCTSDDAATLFHMLLDKCCQDSDDVEKQNYTILSQASRGKFEKSLSTDVLEPILSKPGVESRLEFAAAHFGSGNADDDGAAFVAELREKYSDDEMDTKRRSEISPALWRFRRRFALQDFTIDLNLNQENARQHPVLSKFLQEEVQLRGLRCLPHLLEFQSLLLNRYSRRLDHETASRLTLGEVIRTSPEPSKWSAAFEGFCQAWNDCMPFAEKYGCLPIPDIYKNVNMGPQTPLSFCLPCEKDEGICSLNLARFMGEKHNSFVNAVDELLLMRGEEQQRSSLRQNEVSSRFFSPAQAIVYNLSDYMVFLEQQCVQLSEAGHLQFDFDIAELHLIDAYLGGKPLLQLEMRMMQYISSVDENAGVSLDSDASLDSLRRKVRQEPLPKDLMQSLLKELGSPSAARSCLELLETAVTFLQETGGNLVQNLDIGEKLLAEYVSLVLLMPAEVVRQNLGLKSSGSVFYSQLRLKHIESVHVALRDFLTVDPFAQVRPKYKDVLDQQTSQEVTALAKSNSLDASVLLPVLKNFIITTLNEDLISEKVAIKEVAAYLESDDVYLSDLPWFANFPESIRMGNVVDFFNTVRGATQLN